MERLVTDRRCCVNLGSWRTHRLTRWHTSASRLRKNGLARGWSLPQLEERTGIDAGHWSRIERGVRPPTELIAAKCDEAFPERRGWFSRVLPRQSQLGTSRLPVVDRRGRQRLVAA